MKQTRNLFTLCMIMLAFATLTLAQPEGGPGRGGPSEEQIKAQMDEMAEAVGLTDAQRDTIMVIQKKHMEAGRAKMEEAHGSRRDMMKSFKSIQDEMDKEIIAQLTDEQVPKYEKFVEQRRKERRKEMRRRD